MQAVHPKEPSDTPMDGVAPANPSNDVAAIVNNALQQQAAQFEAIFGGLQAQIAGLAIKPTVTTKDKRPKAASNPSTPAARKGPRLSANQTPPATSKSPKTRPKTATPVRKRQPLQVMVTDTPSDFKTTKEALYVHIKMMWGLYRPTDIPPRPDPTLMKEFYLRFSSVEEIEWAINDPSSADLVAKETIMSLKELRTGGSKLSRGLGHIDQISILYMLGVLAKTGLQAWGPDPEDTPDSLYNSACRITCLNTFRQLVASGTYNYMNVNLKHADSISLLISAYNHYVHFVMVGKYKSEKKKAGQVGKVAAKKTVQKNRERLRDSRAEFLMRHRSKFPSRYRKLVADTLAHSDDELIREKNVYVIKTLNYRSKNASKFFRRLDAEILKEAEINGQAVRRRVRKLPKEPIASEFVRAPKNLPIDFYDPTWFKALAPAQKRLIVDCEQVALLPNASQSLKPTRHPDELLGDSRFTAKYLDIILEPYELSDDEGGDVEDEETGPGVSDSDEDIISDDEEEAEEEEEPESEFYDECDFGDLYEDEV